MAYRGLGDLDQARDHLARQGEGAPRPEDPLMRELDELLLSPEAFDVRGGAALDAGNWSLAADYFRRGLELASDNVSLRHRLGTALFQLGDAQGAEEQFRRVVRTSPEHTRAQFSLGVLMAASGRYDDAISRFSTALERDPGYLQARLQLAAVLARHSRPEEALGHYERVLEMDPTLFEAAFGHSMALVRLRRFEEARDRLLDATATYPDQPVFTHALARVLAAAPDDRVRDGQRARVLVEALLEQDQSVELGETIAMTLAELGEYAQAAAVQRDVIAAAEQAGLRDVVQRMRANLRLYERGEPCRTPWSEDELP
jgi:tetratricopeptide (TPR) repeat protein